MSCCFSLHAKLGLDTFYTYPMSLCFWGKTTALKPPNFPKCLIVHLRFQGGGKESRCAWSLKLISQQDLTNGRCCALPPHRPPGTKSKKRPPCSSKYLRTWRSFLLTWTETFTAERAFKIRQQRKATNAMVKWSTRWSLKMTVYIYSITLQSLVSKTKCYLQQCGRPQTEAAGYHLPLSWTSVRWEIIPVFSGIFLRRKQVKPLNTPPVLWATSIFIAFSLPFYLLAFSIMQHFVPTYQIFQTCYEFLYSRRCISGDP